MAFESPGMGVPRLAPPPYFKQVFTNALSPDYASAGVSTANYVFNLAAAIADAAGGILFFPAATYRISSNVSFPQNVSVQFAPGAMLSIDGGVTVTILGPIIADLSRIFGGAGAVAFGNRAASQFFAQWFGAAGDGVTDDTGAIQSAVNAAKANDVGGELCFPRGIYQFSSLDVSGVRNLILRGIGSAAPFTVGTAQLRCTRADAGVGVSLADAQGVSLRDLCIDTSSALFTGTLVKTGHGALGRDPSHLRFRNIAFSAQAGTCVLLDLEFSIIASVEKCAFRGGTRQIIGHQGNYCNGVAIRDCEFAGSSLVPILQPGEAWSIVNCVFESLASGAQGAVDIIAGLFYSYGFIYHGNYHGDASSAGNPWVRIRTLGGSFQGGEFVMAAGGIGIQIAAGSTCPTGFGIRMSQNGAGAIGVDFEATVTKPVFMGNDLQLDTPFRNRGNCVGGTIRNNNNATEIIDFPNAATTPSVGGGDKFNCSNFSGPATTITNFLNGFDGQLITVFLSHNDTIQHNGSIHTNGGGNVVGADGMVIQFVRTGSTWVEVSRVTNS